jgi:hypothetical protein
MTKLRKGIISPTEKQGAGYVFETAGKLFKVTGNVIEEATGASEEFNALSKALKTFKVDESGVQFNYDLNNKSQITDLNEAKSKNYDELVGLQDKAEFLKTELKESKLAGKKAATTELEKELAEVNETILTLTNRGIQVSFKYDANENKTFIGNREVITEGVTEQAFASALIRYEDKGLLNLFETAAKNFGMYNILEFVTESQLGDVKVSTIRTENRVYAWRINEATKIGKFIQMEPQELINYVAEETGADITASVQDLLDGIKEQVEDRENAVALRREMISFLQDQKGRLAEADRNIPAIKEADHFLSSEIKRIGEEIESLEEAKLGRDEGYLEAILKVDFDKLPKGTSVLIDAMEYAAAAKTDLLTVFKDEKPLRIEKRAIELPSSDLT